MGGARHHRAADARRPEGGVVVSAATGANLLEPGRLQHCHAGRRWSQVSYTLDSVSSFTQKRRPLALVADVSCTAPLRDVRTLLQLNLVRVEAIESVN